MTLDVFPDPGAGVDALLEAAKAARWATATISTDVPDGDITAPVIQHAWDGTPSQQVNRANTTVRVTVWTPRGQADAGITLAQLVKAYLLDSGSTAIWRFRGGAGPSHGTDKANGLPFATFILTAETRPTRVA